jgi:hypothetical protein
MHVMLAGLSGRQLAHLHHRVRVVGPGRLRRERLDRQVRRKGQGLDCSPVPQHCILVPLVRCLLALLCKCGNLPAPSGLCGASSLMVASLLWFTEREEPGRDQRGPLGHDGLAESRGRPTQGGAAAFARFVRVVVECVHCLLSAIVGSSFAAVCCLEVGVRQALVSVRCCLSMLKLSLIFVVGAASHSRPRVCIAGLLSSFVDSSKRGC